MMSRIRTDLDNNKDVIIQSLLDKTKTLTQLSIEYNCKYDTLRSRVKKWIPDYKPDYTSHLKKYRGINKWNNLSEYIKFNGGACKRNILYRLLIEERGNCCYLCKINGFWNGKELRLQVDHINGNPFDNNAENLRLLCPNCHSQTENFSARNKLKRPCSPKAGGK